MFKPLFSWRVKESKSKIWAFKYSKNPPKKSINSVNEKGSRKEQKAKSYSVSALLARLLIFQVGKPRQS